MIDVTLIYATSQFKARYLSLYGNSGPPKPAAQGNAKLAQLLANYTTDDDHLADNNPTVDPNASKPWLVEFNQYLNGTDSVPEKMSLTQWWGVSQFITHRRT